MMQRRLVVLPPTSVRGIMDELLKPINTKSLKDEFVSRFEKLILSGKLRVGERLPSERDLAKQLKVSRPVVHDGILDLANKGLVRMVPRRGAFVSDFRRDGSLELLFSLVNFQGNHLDKELMDSLLRLRELFEIDAAKLAAEHWSDQDRQDLQDLLRRESSADFQDLEGIVELDYQFHLGIARASGNVIYPLLMNSVKVIYTNFLREFFSEGKHYDAVFRHHKEIVECILNRDSDGAGHLMQEKLAEAKPLMDRINQINRDRQSII